MDNAAAAHHDGISHVVSTNETDENICYSSDGEHGDQSVSRSFLYFQNGVDWRIMEIRFLINKIKPLNDATKILNVSK